MTDTVLLRCSVMFAASLLLTACADQPSSTMPPPPPPPPAFTMSVLQSDQHYVRHTQLLALDLIVKRAEGFAEPIKFSSDGPPEIVVQFNPGTVISSDRTDVTIVAATSASRTRHDITLIGRSQGGAEQRILVEVTVE